MLQLERYTTYLFTLYVIKYMITVAILAQGTHWAVANSQAFCLLLTMTLVPSLGSRRVRLLPSPCTEQPSKVEACTPKRNKQTSNCVGGLSVCWSVVCVLFSCLCVVWLSVCWLSVCWLFVCVLVGCLCVGWLFVCWLVVCVLVGCL